MKNVLRWGAVFGLPMLLLALFATPVAHTMDSIQFVLRPEGMLFALAGATIGASVVTLYDHAKRRDPDGGIPKIAELLSQTNEMLEDMHWKEGNQETGHRVTMRTGLPSVFWRLFNQGVAKSKSTTAQIDEQCGMLEARSEVDKDLADLNGNTASFRLSEATPFLEAMNQELQQTLIYGNSGVSPEEITGFALRYSSLAAANGQNIINAGGVGADNASIYLVCWGEETVFGIFPKGSKAGLIHEDLGVGDAFDANNNRFRAYMDRWQFKGGIVVKDWRYAVRIANIDISNLIADAAGASVKLVEYMGKSIDRIPSPGMGRLAFYTNRTVKSMLRLQALNKSIANLGVEPAINQFGKTIHQLTFLGIPIRTVDQLTEAEAAVT